MDEAKIRSALGASDWILDAVHNPRFEERERVHDWRTYVPVELWLIWDQLSVETRLVVISMADRQAGAEDWD